MEIFGLYDAARRPTGQTMVRGTPVPEGCYRQVVHVRIFFRCGHSGNFDI